ncbi:protein IQ-DOMAIN 3-like isoform X1 [Lycium barbarum]|uniref:protein IQ-DOMAIN 3-like isoform X1 n=1 Tax=Lycium barbarum TaxID=112863 RepID=UPI00293EE8A5|nr:protein IQ-DOMAIN 3-like isoform X1 [Lycium barbarum]XP_060185287.1 protein IQ-DOMAIN 3-like isoform X1 [Lycium barbarum]XP_060185288.1 protein IQ-DOMAIN 3-like isoform X1 [Lycium barbarum]XP_060185289.1 protein IQ-DOMAIN 3-like isoform X1 [Lycium barbarum]
MGKKGSWFSAVRKALGSGNKKKDKKKHKCEKWSGKQQSDELDSSNAETALVSPAPPTPPPPPVEHLKLIEAENEQNKHAHSVALATAVAAEAAVAAAQAAAEVVRLTAAACISGKSKEEIAAIRIQTVFRGYLARRALRALRGLVRLKTMIQGQSVKRQATSTLRCMQTLARVQSQVRARRIRMSEENQALQRQLQQKHEKEQEKLKASSQSGDDWNNSIRSKEQVEANLQMKQEAAMRREKALAYAYTHQPIRRNPSKSTNETFMDPNNPHWGWSWLERWMAARPWEDKCATDKEVNSDEVAANSPASHPTAVAANSPRDFHLDNRPSPTAHKQSRPPSRQSTPRSKTGRVRPASPRGSNVDDDSRSMASAQSEHCRRHSFAGSSIRDDESLASSPAVPSYMAATESARARSRLPSPLGFEKSGTPEKGTVSSAKKRLSFSASPGGAPRRHSGPPKVEI